MSSGSQHPTKPEARVKIGGSHATGSSAGEDDTHLLDRLAVVYRYRAIAISVFVLTTLAVIIQGSSAIPMYVAHARILIESERSTAVIGLSSTDSQYFEDPEPYYNTQYKILQGRDLARRVVRKLQLETIPEFNGTAPSARTWMTIVRENVERVRGLFERSTTAEPEVPAPSETPDESALVDAFLSRLVVEPSRGTRLVDVSFESMDPQLAARAANTLAQEYVAQNLEVKLQATDNMLQWLTQELATQQKKVQSAEAAMADYRDRQNALSLDDRQNIVLARLNKLNDDVIGAKTRKAQKEVLYNQIKGLTPAELGKASAIAQNVQVAAAQARVQEAQAERVRLAQRYGEKHPDLLKATANVQEAERVYLLEVTRAAQAIKNDYETTVLEERTYTQNLNAAKTDAQDLSKKSVNYNLMEREANSDREVYQALLQRENELRVSSNSRANNVRVVDSAEVPKGPEGQGQRSWPMGIALGLVLAVAVPFMLDYLNDTIKTPEDITQRLKVSFLGLVPSVRGNKYPLLTSSHVPHDFGEAFRSLRTALLSKYEGAGTKIVVFTSAQPLEGKTTTAVNLAMALAYGGARVLILDADMRRPGLHRPLRLTNERGLSQVLVGQARVRDVIQRTVDPNLLAVTAGKVPPNPSELLTSERMKTLLTNLVLGPFDWIIIDTVGSSRVDLQACKLEYSIVSPK